MPGVMSQQVEIEIINERGLHTRAASKFAACSARYECTITVSANGETVDGTSILSLLLLGAGPGSVLTITAEGDDAAEALVSLRDLVASGFGE